VTAQSFIRRTSDQILQRAQFIDGSRVDESCFVWDGNGRLVAQGTQPAAIRLG